MTLAELFPRMKKRIKATLSSKFAGLQGWGEVIEGPYGFVSMSPRGQYIDVIVDVCSTKLLNRTVRILADPMYMLCNDGEYNFRLDLTDKYRAMQLIGFRPDRRG